MLFNSIEYFIFFPIVFLVFWLLKKNLLSQNILILCASYFFYALWDYRFLSLIVLSSFTDYSLALLIKNAVSSAKKKFFLAISLLVNLGLLFVFKYYNFFISEYNLLLDGFGYQASLPILEIILPVGISFYTFQTLSYTLDVYKEKIEPTKNIVAFFAYVSFFPQLVAGPIERASNLLPQFFKKKQVDYAAFASGSRQILLGLFKKVVIADNCAVFVDNIFSNYSTLSGFILLLGAILFIIQIYCDFSGYSDVAIGSAQLLGFNLMQNFSTPYFSTSITELWRRWHISLSQWFRDYLFKPLLFRWRDYDKIGFVLATIVCFTVIGFWHGANWTYILFGFLHALAMIYEFFTKKVQRKVIRKAMGKKFYYATAWLLTMTFWIFTCILFRAPSVTVASDYIANMFSFTGNFAEMVQVVSPDSNIFILICVGLAILFLFLCEAFNKDQIHSLVIFPKNVFLKSLAYTSMILLVLQFLVGQKSFIYFQF